MLRRRRTPEMSPIKFFQSKIYKGRGGVGPGVCLKESTSLNEISIQFFKI